MRNRSSIINNSVCANKRRITEGKNENVKTIHSNADCRHKLFFTNKYHKEFSIREREIESDREKWNDFFVFFCWNVTCYICFIVIYPVEWVCIIIPWMRMHSNMVVSFEHFKLENWNFNRLNKFLCFAFFFCYFIIDCTNVCYSIGFFFYFLINSDCYYQRMLIHTYYNVLDGSCSRDNLYNETTSSFCFCQ